MPKHYYIQNTESEHSIDLSKPEGMCSFWNLFSKPNNKEGLQVVNNEQQKIKLNSIALKILKRKGIDLKNIDCSGNNDFQSLKQGKIMVIRPSQINLNQKDMLKGNMLLNILKSNKSPKDLTDMEVKVMSSSPEPKKSGPGLIKSSLTYLRSRKPNTYRASSKTRLQRKERGNRTFKLLSSTLSEHDMLRIISDANQRKRPRKKVIVPIYVGKKRSRKLKHSEDESLLDCDENNEAINVASLITKINKLEGQLKNLECKSKVNSSFQLETATLITNKAETINYTLSDPNSVKQNGKNDKGNCHFLLKQRFTESHHENLTLSDLCRNDDGEKESDQTKEKDNNKKVEDVKKEDGQKKLEGQIEEEENIKQGIKHLVEILNNPDTLIQNHNLIVPGDLSEESLFQANPFAGCDTVLKLFKVLSEKSKNYKNEPKNINQKLSREKVIKSECVNKTDDGTQDKINKDITNQTSSSDQNAVNSSFDGSGDQYKSIFSLPVNFNDFILSSHKKIYEKNEEKLQQSLSKPDILPKPIDNIVHEEDVSAKEKEGLTTYPKQSKTNIENIIIHNENGSEDVSEVSKVSSFEKSELLKSKVDETKIGANSVTCDKLENSTHSVLQTNEGTFREISDSKLNENDLINMNIIKLNMNGEKSGMQAIKLLKSTTIFCPVKLPDDQVSITLLIENNRIDESKKQEDVPNTKFTLGDEVDDSQNLNSTPDLKEHVFIKKDPIVEKKEASVACAMNIPNEMPSNKVIKSNINSNTDCEQSLFTNYCENKDIFGLNSNVTYLNKERRKALEETVLSVEQHKNEEQDKNLSDLKINQQYKKCSVNNLKHSSSLSNIMRPCTEIYNQNTSTKNRCSTLDTQQNMKTLYKPETCNRRNPFCKQNFNLKKPSNTYIFQHSGSRSLDRNNRTKNIIINGFHTSNNIITTPLPKTKNRLADSKQKINQDLNSLGCKENSFIGHSYKRPCRCSLTVNQESLNRQVEKNQPFLESYEKTVQKQKEEINNYNFNMGDSNQRQCIIKGSVNKEVQVLKTPYENSLPINGLVYKTVPVICALKDSNTIESSEIESTSFDEKLPAPLGEPTTLTGCLLENIVSSCRELGRKCLETELNFQYKKVGNGAQGNSENNLILPNSLESNRIISSEDLSTYSKYVLENQGSTKNIFQSVTVKTEITCNTVESGPCCCVTYESVIVPELVDGGAEK